MEKSYKAKGRKKRILKSSGNVPDLRSVEWPLRRVHQISEIQIPPSYLLKKTLVRCWGAIKVQVEGQKHFMIALHISLLGHSTLVLVAKTASKITALSK